MCHGHQRVKVGQRRRIWKLTHPVPFKCTQIVISGFPGRLWLFCISNTSNHVLDRRMSCTHLLVKYSMEINLEHCLIHKCCWFILKHAITFLLFFPRALLFRRKRRKPSVLLTVERTLLIGWDQEVPKECWDCTLPPSLMLNGFVLVCSYFSPNFLLPPALISVASPTSLFFLTCPFQAGFLQSPFVSPTWMDCGSSPWDHILRALSAVSSSTVAQMLSNSRFPSLFAAASGQLFWKRVPSCIVRNILAMAPVASASSCLCHLIMNIWSTGGCRCCQL